MNFTLVTFGSEGDTRPFVALGQGLMKAGHDVLLFGEQSSLARARECNVPSQPLAGDVKATLPVIGAGRDANLKIVFESIKAIKTLVNDNTESWLECIASHARSSDAVLYSGLAYCHGEAVAQAFQKPRVALGLQPFAASREFSSWALPPMRLPRWMNRMSYGWSLTRVLRLAFGKKVQELRGEILGVPARAPADIRDDQKKCLTLYGLSRFLVAPPADWPSTHRICGHWALESAGFKPSQRLEDFLAAGDAPIYVGLGSVSGFLGHRTLTTIVAAVGGRRAVFFPGWSQIDSTMLPDNFFVLDHVPHSWLFPRVSMAMHHCGAGTTHSACHAGIPSVALPMGADQPHWASRLAQAGVAANYVNLRKLRGASLQGMIAFAERAETLARARALGAAMAQEDGIGNAVTQIEDFVRSSTG